jgi:hypothetical protein
MAMADLKYQGTCGSYLRWRSDTTVLASHDGVLVVGRWRGNN